MGTYERTHFGSQEDPTLGQNLEWMDVDGTTQEQGVRERYRREKRDRIKWGLQGERNKGFRIDYSPILQSMASQSLWSINYSRIVSYVAELHRQNTR